MTLTINKNPSGESILVIPNPYNWQDFKHPEISVKIEITKLDGTTEERIDQGGVFNLGTLDNGKYNLKYFNESNCPDLTPPNNRGKTNIDSFEINDTTTLPPDDTSGITPDLTPATPGRLGSPGLTPGTKITGNFVDGFKIIESSVMNGLADPTKLRQEVTNLLANWPEIRATITTRFNPNKITDTEIKGLATNIIGSRDNLNRVVDEVDKVDVSKKVDEVLTKLTMARKVSLTKIIVAYNVEFPQKVEGSLPGSGKATSINDDNDVFKITKEEEDREALLAADLKRLEGISKKIEKDVTGLITLLTQNIKEENAIEKKKLVLIQLADAVGDFKNFKSRFATTGEITVSEANLSEVKEMKEKIATLTEKQPIVMPEGWNADTFKSVKGIGKFKEYEAQLKKVNNLLERQNDKRKVITKAADGIDTDEIRIHTERFIKIEAQVNAFDNELESLQQKISQITIPKQLQKEFINLGKLLQKNYQDIKDTEIEIRDFEKVIFGLIKSMAKITKHNGKMRGVKGWFEQMGYRKSGTLKEERKNLNVQKEILETLLNPPEIATPTPVATPVPTPPKPAEEKKEESVGEKPVEKEVSKKETPEEAEAELVKELSPK